jgi:hypothetical protein
VQLHQEYPFTDLADNLSLPLEFVILEAEEKPPYKIARIGEFLHVLSLPSSQPCFVLCQPVYPMIEVGCDPTLRCLTSQHQMAATLPAKPSLAMVGEVSYDRHHPI